MSCKKLFSSLIIDPLRWEDLPDVLVIEKESFLSPWSAGLFARELESSLSVCLAARLHGAAETLLVGYIIFG